MPELGPDVPEQRQVQRLLADACAYLLNQVDGASQEPIHVSISRNHVQVQIAITEASPERVAQLLQNIPLAGQVDEISRSLLDELEARIVHLLRQGPLAGDVIGRRLGENPSTIRAVLARLVRCGVLCKRDGYAVARPVFLEIARAALAAGGGGESFA